MHNDILDILETEIPDITKALLIERIVKKFIDEHIGE